MADLSHITVGVSTTALLIVLRILAAPREAPIKGVLVYQRMWRALAMGLFLLPLIVFDVIALTRAWSLGDLLLLFATFGGVSIVFALPIAIEVFRVSYVFDDNGIQVRSPWSKRRSIKWSEVTGLRWRNTMKWLDISTSKTVVHITPLLLNLDEFSMVCRQHVPDELRASGDVDAVLRFMAMGRAHELAFASVRPSKMR
jgi:hypothetical protein